MDVDFALQNQKRSQPVLKGVNIPNLIPDSALKTTYILGEFLGKGGFASCYKARDSASGLCYALKVLPKFRLTKPHHWDKVKREIFLHFPLKHKNVVQMFSAFDDSDNIYMLLELCAKQSMIHLLQTKKNNRLDERLARQFMRQLVDGVRFLHDDANILHRDLKLGNLLLSSSSASLDPSAGGGDGLVLKIADLGLATTFDLNNNDVDLSILGTDLAADDFKVFAMLFGKPPFETNCIDLTYRLIQHCQYNLFENKEKSSQQVDMDFKRVSYHARHLISQFLQLQPENRPRFNDHLLMHSFFREDFSHLSTHQIDASLLKSAEVSKLGFLCAPQNYQKNCDGFWPTVAVSSSGDSGFSPDTPRRRPVGPGAIAGRSSLSSALTTATSISPPSAATGADFGGYFLPPDVGPLRKSSSCGYLRREFTWHFADLLADLHLKLSQCSTPATSSSQILAHFPNENVKDFSGVRLVPASFFLLRQTSGCPTCRAAAAEEFRSIGQPLDEKSDASSHLTLVTKWVDYSNRQGLGFVYGDGTACVKFNDGSCVLVDSTRRQWARFFTPSLPTHKVSYQSSVKNEGGAETLVDLSVPVVDSELSEKLKISLSFADYMDNNLIDAFHGYAGSNAQTDGRHSCHNFICQTPYLFYWRRFDDQIIFLFSDGTFQVNFTESHVKVVVQPRRLLDCKKSSKSSQNQLSFSAAVRTTLDDYCLSFVDRVGGKFFLGQPLSTLFAAHWSDAGGLAVASDGRRTFIHATLQRLADAVKRVGDHFSAAYSQS